jgi:hypothetical protein
MFVVFVGSVLTSAIAIDLLLHPGAGGQSARFVAAISAWLWLTVLFANFAEAIAEGRGKAQAAALRSTRGEVTARKLAEPRHGAPAHSVPAGSLRRGDIVQVRQGGRFRPTVKSSSVPPRSMRAPLPANQRRCCASRGATSRRSRAARGCCRTGWSFA